MTTDNIYFYLVDLLKDIKLTQGPTAVTSTLRRHSNVKKFLLQYQVHRLADLEAKLIDIEF